MFENLREKWKKIVQVAASREAAFAAIKEGDVNGLQKSLTALCREDLTYHEKMDLVRTSIRKRNVDIFRAVIGFIGDPNFEMNVSYRSTKPGQVTRYSWTPLSYALTFDLSHDIALYLANDPRTRVNSQDVVNAREAGMQDVAEALQRACNNGWASFGQVRTMTPK